MRKKKRGGKGGTVKCRKARKCPKSKIAEETPQQKERKESEKQKKKERKNGESDAPAWRNNRPSNKSKALKNLYPEEPGGNLSKRAETNSQLGNRAIEKKKFKRERT